MFQKNYAYGYNVDEYDAYGNPNIHSKHEERNGYEVKGMKYNVIIISNLVKIFDILILTAEMGDWLHSNSFSDANPGCQANNNQTRTQKSIKYFLRTYHFHKTLVQRVTFKKLLCIRVLR